MLGLSAVVFFIANKDQYTTEPNTAVLGVGSVVEIPVEVLEAQEQQQVSTYASGVIYANDIGRSTTLQVKLFAEESLKKEYEFKRKLKAAKVEEVKRFYARFGYPPLYEYAEVLVDAADKYGLDYRLMPAISIIESGGGKKLFKPYNPFGWGQYSFSSFEEAIYYVAERLRRFYYDLGWVEPRKIAYKYNGPTPEHWGRKAEWLVSLMKPEDQLKRGVNQQIE